MIRQFGSNELAYIVLATRWTLVLSAIAFAGGGALGLAIALARTARGTALRVVAAAYIALLQGAPLLMVIFLAYFGVGLVGIQIPPFTAAAIGLTLYAAAFLGEIWRGCIEAIPRQQWEAAVALGIGPLLGFLYVIAPQAVRIAVPPTVGFLVQLIKNTSLASIIGFIELSRAGQLVNNATFQPFTVFIVVAAIYFALCYPLSLLSQRLERRLNVGRRHLQPA
jgi:polar amino acid transport system permease protein